MILNYHTVQQWMVLNASVDVTGSTLTITPELDFNGDIVVDVSVSDGVLTDTNNFTLSVFPVNDAPVLTDIPDQSIDEDTVFTYTLTAIDVDDLELLYSATVDGNASVDVTGSTLTITPELDFNGDIVVDVSVSDGVLTDTNNFTLSVLPVNDAPVLTDIPDQSIDEDTAFTYTLTAIDVDSDETIYSIVIIEGDATYDLNDSQLSIYPDSNFNGNIQITIAASDGDLATSQSFTLSVLPVNDAPVLTDIPDQSIDEDTVFTYTLTATDVDDLELLYSATVDGNASVDVTGSTLTITPDLDFNGDIQVNITASDNQLIDVETFTITVNPINDQPEITTIDISIIEGSSISIPINVIDVDSESFEIFIVDYPDGGTIIDIDNNLLLITYQPFINFFGSDSFQYRIFDGIDYSDTATINIDVAPVNDAPVLVDINTQSVNEDEIFTLVLNANDIDDEILEFSAFVNGNAVSSISDSLLTITPNLNFNGSIIVTYTVSDGELTDSDNFILEVNPVNDSPVLNTILDDSIDEDSVFNYELTAMDVDNSQFIFSASIEENGSVEISDSTLTVIPDLNFNGNLVINITVSDGELSDSNSFNLFINAVNDAPILSDIQNQVINEDEIFFI